MLVSRLRRPGLAAAARSEGRARHFRATPRSTNSAQRESPRRRVRNGTADAVSVAATAECGRRGFFIRLAQQGLGVQEEVRPGHGAILPDGPATARSAGE